MMRHSRVCITMIGAALAGLLSLPATAMAQRGASGWHGGSGWGGAWSGTSWHGWGGGSGNGGSGWWGGFSGHTSPSFNRSGRWGGFNAGSSFNASGPTFRTSGFPNSFALLTRPAGTTTTTLTHPTANSSLIRTTSPNGTSTVQVNQPTPGTNTVTRNSNLTFQDALTAFRTFSGDVHQLRPIINGTTTVTRPSSTTETFRTALRSGGTSTTTISHPTPLTTTVTTTRPFGNSSTTLTLSASGDTVHNNSTITFNQALQGFRTFNPATSLGLGTTSAP